MFRKSLVGHYLICLVDNEAQVILKETKEGECGNHTGGTTLFFKILRTGYYWLNMNKDTMKYAQRCDKFQTRRKILHQPTEPLDTILSSWPFMKWECIFFCKLPIAPVGKVFILAMTDYFF